MNDISQDEDNAIQVASDHLDTTEEIQAFRAGWMAGRDYERQQQAVVEPRHLSSQ